jgi:hypothetical protein
MADVYKIGVSILLTSNASGVLGLMAKQLTGINTQVKNLATNWGRTATIIKGGLGIALGVGIVKGMAAVAKHGEELLDQQDKMLRNRKITQGMVDQLTSDAFNKITKDVPTATAADVIKATNELVLVTGDFNKARAAVTQSLKTEALISNSTGKSASGQGYDIWRAIEMKGDSMDPAKADAVMGKITAMVIASAGKISGSQVRNFAQQAGSGWSNANDHALGGSIPYMINEMGGERAGTGWNRMSNTIQATRRWTHQQYDAWKKLGLIDQGNVLGGDLGGQLNFKPGASPIKGGMANLGDMEDEITNVIRPAFLKAGITDPQRVDSWLSKLFPDSVAAKFAQRLYRQADNIEKDRVNIDAAKPQSEAYGDLVSNNPKGVMEAYNKQLDSMLSAMGGPLMQAAIPVMRQLTDVFQQFGAFSAGNGEAIKSLGIGLGVLAGFLTAGGAAAILAALGPAGWIVGGLAALGTAVAMIGPGKIWAQMKTDFAHYADLIQADFARYAEILKSFGTSIAAACGTAAGLLAEAASKIAAAIVDIGKRALAAVGGMYTAPGAGTKGLENYGPTGALPAAPMRYDATPPRGRGGIQASAGDVYLDSQKVGTHVARAIARNANGPVQGSVYADATQGYQRNDSFRMS